MFPNISTGRLPCLMSLSMSMSIYLSIYPVNVRLCKLKLCQKACSATIVKNSRTTILTHYSWKQCLMYPYPWLRQKLWLFIYLSFCMWYELRLKLNAILVKAFTPKLYFVRPDKVQLYFVQPNPAGSGLVRWKYSYTQSGRVHPGSFCRVEQCSTFAQAISLGEPPLTGFGLKVIPFDEFLLALNDFLKFQLLKFLLKIITKHF